MAKLQVHLVHTICGLNGINRLRRRYEYTLDWTHPLPPTIGIAFRAKLDGARRTVRIYDITLDLKDGSTTLWVASYVDEADSGPDSNETFVPNHKPAAITEVADKAA